MPDTALRCRNAFRKVKGRAWFLERRVRELEAEIAGLRERLRTGQPVRQTHAEITIDIAIGFVISVIFNAVMLIYLHGLGIALQSTIMTTVFVVLSYVRRYILRRHFNRRQTR